MLTAGLAILTLLAAAREESAFPLKIGSRRTYEGRVESDPHRDRAV